MEADRQTDTTKLTEAFRNFVEAYRMIQVTAGYFRILSSTLITYPRIPQTLEILKMPVYFKSNATDMLCLKVPIRQPVCFPENVSINTKMSMGHWWLSQTDEYRSTGGKTCPRVLVPLHPPHVSHVLAPAPSQETF
jgi:hypothetical protein